MSRFFCCLGGGGSSKVVQDPQQLPQPPQQPEPSDSSEDEDLSDGVTFRWSEIVDGTENFLATRVLDGGNFGKVYRCDFPRIDKVGAAKIHNHENQFGYGGFLAEITTLQAANHPNVIKLIGKRFGQRESAIIYEFMPNGSLDHHLFAHARRGPGLQQENKVLDWDTRMRIAVGVAEALVYLHTGLKKIHRDVNVTNVLLDYDFTPKLAGFGSANQIFVNGDGVERQRKINPIKGARGYVAPETEELGLVSTKSDVYSYGVFLFVLFTGREAYDLRRSAGRVKLTDWLVPLWSREEYTSLVTDVKLGNKFSVEGLNRLFFTAKMCIDPQAFSRPEMGIVEDMVRQAAAFPVPVPVPVPERLSVTEIERSLIRRSI